MPERSSGGDDLFGPHNLPYGVFTTADEPGRRRLGVRLHDRVLDAGAAARALGSPYEALLAHGDLGPLMAAGRTAWRDVRRALTAWVSVPAHRAELEPLLHPLDTVELHLPYAVADYADFYSNEHHAANAGAILRPGGRALTPNWKHLPVGYHGRAGTVVVSGTHVVRPTGQRKTLTASEGDPRPVFGPTAKLDIEAEVGFVVGAPSPQGAPVPLAAFRDHVFGVCLLNDWSARDIQAWEGQPLGPFLAKSFATSVSAWVTPLEALDAARVAPPARTEPLLPYLDDTHDDEPGGLDLHITVSVNGEEVSHPPFSSMYWTAAQQLAHLTVNGASLRTGDLYGSGTVSGPERAQRGSLLELTWDGAEPLDLEAGKRTYLEDGDEVVLSAWAPGPDGTRVGLGEVTGRVAPAVTGS
ncbi:fumarylacetoacetase [Streptomyces fuscigenes]|uniref:fumarylacetoacetase n=1 Tax=Streptomyces fuscigenes TaxID=1528880 RepID=UPI001F421AA1|nr:fumarylacetoacetase [Streptomyces fuscigenes]MCF3962278.1 fumarylacetoacetase [Streptomyces fuscigenes]